MNAAQAKPDLKSLTIPELEALCRELGWQPYRARQLFSWLWQKDAAEFESMTNLSLAGRRLLSERFVISRLVPDRTVTDDQGTARFRFPLTDGSNVESVYIPEVDRRTVCISTQVGCALNCEICRTARLGLRRNLNWHEIVEQVLAVRQATGSRPTNVVFMGLGEPFLNYEATLQAIEVINSDFGPNVGARRITVSTAGIPDAIRAYARFPLQSKLAVSLNASDNETRSQLMPVNRTHPLEQLLAAVREFAEIKGKRVTFEYVLVRGVNDRPEDVTRLGRLLAGIPCKVNLIPLNPFPGLNLAPPDPETVERFAQALYPLLPAVTIRKSRGSSILAGCGQLAGTD